MSMPTNGTQSGHVTVDDTIGEAVLLLHWLTGASKRTGVSLDT